MKTQMSLTLCCTYMTTRRFTILLLICRASPLLEQPARKVAAELEIPHCPHTVSCPGNFVIKRWRIGQIHPLQNKNFWLLTSFIGKLSHQNAGCWNLVFIFNNNNIKRIILIWFDEHVYVWNFSKWYEMMKWIGDDNSLAPEVQLRIAATYLPSKAALQHFIIVFDHQIAILIKPVRICASNEIILTRRAGNRLDGVKCNVSNGRLNCLNTTT